jgi:hypothetical protein
MKNLEIKSSNESLVKTNQPTTSNNNNAEDRITAEKQFGYFTASIIKERTKFTR